MIKTKKFQKNYKKLCKLGYPQKNPHAFATRVWINMWKMWIIIALKGFRQPLQYLQRP